MISLQRPIWYTSNGTTFETKTKPNEEKEKKEKNVKKKNANNLKTKYGERRPIYLFFLPGAVTLGPKSPSKAGPRLDQVYCMPGGYESKSLLVFIVPCSFPSDPC